MYFSLVDSVSLLFLVMWRNRDTLPVESTGEKNNMPIFDFEIQLKVDKSKGNINFQLNDDLKIVTD